MGDGEHSRGPPDDAVNRLSEALGIEGRKAFLEYHEVCFGKGRGPEGLLMVRATGANEPRCPRSSR